MARINRAGALVFRQAKDGIEVLLVRASKDPAQWVLPKGHIEPGETEEQAALREVREEAGVDGRTLARLGLYSLPKTGGYVLAVMFLAEFSSLVEPSEGREVSWMRLDDARAALGFEDAGRILDRAEELIEKRVRPTRRS